MSKQIENNTAMVGGATITENAVLAKDKKGFPFKKVFFGILVALIVVSLILLVVNIVINSYFSKVKVFEGDITINQEKLNSMAMYRDNEAYFANKAVLHEAYDKALLNYAKASSDLRNDSNVYNYAIYGIDKFVESVDSSADIIMIASVNTADDHVTYLAFETRMLVYIPYVGVGPMADAYLLGGALLLTKTIEENYGLNINGFAEVNMSAFATIIDEFGAISFTGDKAKLEEINASIASFNEAMGLEGEQAVTNAKINSGKIELNGKQSLAYMRTAGEEKANIANSILSQLTSMVAEKSLGGFKTTLDIILEETTVALSRDDVGALIRIGLSVLDKVEAVPVGNMEGRADVSNIGCVTCDYDAERVAVISALYEVQE
ncbi:MAG: LCP family protein [Clostridia bacterium]|nr:LCP family protein [Clostridia bacterium]